MRSYFNFVIVAMGLFFTGRSFAGELVEPIHICLKPEMKTNILKRQVLQNVDHGDKVKGFLYQTARTDLHCSEAQAPGSAVSTLNIVMKIHGQTSQTYDQKSYQIEFVDKDYKGLAKNQQLNFAGLPRGEKFMLTSNYVDRSDMRNPLAYTIAADMGRTRKDTFGTPFVVAEVNIGDGYNGIYTLSARAERAKERIDIPKVDEDHFQDFDWVAEICMGVKAADYHTKKKTAIKYHYPESKDLDKFKDQNKTKLAKQHIIDQLETFETMLAGPNFADPKTGYPAFIDVPSFIDFILLEEFAKNVDGFRRSAWFRHVDGKFRMGPVWDFDISFGNMSLYNMGLSSGWLLDFGQGTWFSPGGIEHNPAGFWFRRLVEDPAFANQLKARYAELRMPGGALNDDHVAEVLAQLQKEIGPAGLRAEKRWQWTRINPLHSVIMHAPPFDRTYEGNVKNLSNWVKARLQWMDTNIQQIEKRGTI